MSEKIMDLRQNTNGHLRRDSQSDKIIKKIHDFKESSKDVEGLLMRGFEINPQCMNLILEGVTLIDVLEEFFEQSESRVALSLTLKENQQERTFTYRFGENLKMVRLKDLPISPYVSYNIEMFGLDVINPWGPQHFMIAMLTITFPSHNDIKKRILLPRHENRSHMTSHPSKKAHYTITSYPFEGETFSEERMHSSFTNWQYENIVSPAALVKNGFYLNDEATKIICVECGYNVETHRLREIDAIQSHKQNSPNCRKTAKCFISQITENSNRRQSENDYEAGRSEQQTSQAATYNPFFNIPAEENKPQENPQRSTSSTDYSSSMQQCNKSNHNNHKTKVPQGAASNSDEHYPTTYSEPHNREDTFRYWDHNKFRDTKVLSAAGFYYTGERDAVRCFSCDIGLADWKPTDDPWVEHARHSPSCAFLKENKSQEFIDKVQNDWSQVYKPRHPRYNELSERIKSFENSGWPQDYVRQTPSELAVAGFFYKGERDTVRCHYCDGGLRDWEPEDDPWIEHGRWFSYCKFVIRQKGIPFIQECATGNRSRPAISEPYVPKNLPKSYTNQEIESAEEKWRKIELENPMKTAAAISVKEIGYSNATVKGAINTYIARTGKRDFDASSLMQIIFEWEEQGNVFPEHTYSTNEKRGSESENDEFEYTPQALMKENEVIKHKFTCVACKTRERTNVFLPCGHRLMCEECAKKQTHCGHCNREIRDTIKSFLA